MTEKLVNFMLDEDMYHSLKILAARENRRIKEILKEEIENYVKIHENGNPQHLIQSYIENEDFVGFPSIAIDYENKKSYIERNCISNKKLNDFGIELFGHVSQWYEELRKR